MNSTPSNLIAPGLSRRRVLALPWAAWLGGSGLVHAQSSNMDTDTGRLVVVFLRGAADGLSIFVPHADTQYTQLRRETAIPAPNGTANTALTLDSQFGLHPALAPLWPLWQQGQLSFIPTAGLTQVNRSHFEAQHQWETGQPDLRQAAPGWLNTWASQHRTDDTSPCALGVGESNPEILRGPAVVRLLSRGNSALNAGVLTGTRNQRALLDMYGNDTALGKTFAQGARSRLETAQTLKEAKAAMTADTPQAEGWALDARHLGILMRQDPRLRVGFLSTDGWDTHANQGGVQGTLAQQLKQLGLALIELHQAFNRPNDVVVVVSEFGRTCAENGTRGTDHGYGNALWLMGPRIQGGRWHGRWEGLSPGQLHARRELPVFHDFRAVLSLILRETQGASDEQLAAVFPGNPFAGSDILSGPNRALAGLLRS